MAKRKPWRKFKMKRLKDPYIRWVCLAILVAEIAVLEKQERIFLPVIKVTENREVVIYQPPQGDGRRKMKTEPLEVPPKDQIYGIRIRLKEGMVDFYRKEELHEERNHSGQSDR